MFYCVNDLNVSIDQQSANASATSKLAQMKRTRPSLQERIADREPTKAQQRDGVQQVQLDRQSGCQRTHAHGSSLFLLFLGLGLGRLLRCGGGVPFLDDCLVRPLEGFEAL